MMEAIIPALISGAVTLIVCMINNASQRKKTEAQHNTTITLIEYKLDELSKRVNKHNKVISRLYEVERKLGIDEEKIRSCKRRIDDLEHEKGRN